MKIGDKVTFRQWDDMVKEFGTNINGSICTSPFCFTESMKYLCGQTVTVKHISANGQIFTKELIELHQDNNYSVSMWRLCEEMFEESDSFNDDQFDESVLIGFLTS